MKKFLQENKKFLLLVVGISFFLVLITVFSFNHFSDSLLKKTNQLAQITAIETELLKQWQQSQGLKNTLDYNSSGKDVVLLQRMLAQDKSIYPEKKITGYYGNLTKKAVIQFQKEYNLPPTGIVDEQTKNKLNAIFLQSLCPEETTIYPDFLLKKINKQSPLPADYIPPSLEDVSGKVKTIGIICLREDIVPSLIAMFQAAEKDGINFAITSGYRRPEIQKYLYDYWLKMHGQPALNEIANPYFSEHQLGTAVDLTDDSIGYKGASDSFANSRGSRWLAENAYQYGFIMSYPQNQENITGYKYEPWHWRFVGKEIATFLHNQNLTFNEFAFDFQKIHPLADIQTGLNLSADGVISILVNKDGNAQILIEKNKNVRMPILGLTKLMVALVSSYLYQPDDVVTISNNLLSAKENTQDDKNDNSFYFQDVLQMLLIDSQNEEIATDIAQKVGTESFVNLMNQKAKELNLTNTHFFNVTDTETKEGSEEMNYSTPLDIAKLLKYIFENKKDIFSILAKNTYHITNIHHTLQITINTTNKLLDNQDVPFRVLGGSDSQPLQAKSNLALVSQAPQEGQIISVILGSKNNFLEMLQLLQFINNSFVWK